MILTIILAFSIYCSVMTISLCYYTKLETGFIGVYHSLRMSFTDRQNLSSILTMWALALLFILDEVVEGIMTLDKWSLAVLNILHILSLSVTTSILSRIDLSFKENSIYFTGNSTESQSQVKPRGVVFLVLLSFFLLNFFLLSYDTCVVTLRILQGVEKTQMMRTIIFISSLGSVWFRGVQSNFYLNKIILPEYNVFSYQYELRSHDRDPWWQDTGQRVIS